MPTRKIVNIDNVILILDAVNMTALASASSNCKRATHPIVKESAPHKQPLNCLTETNIWSWIPDSASLQDILAD
jgi:hypothetical protein